MPLSLKKILFHIPPGDITFAKRGFGACEPQVRERLEAVCRVFTEGYKLALDIPDDGRLAATLTESFDAHHVGFAFEGAGFYYALRGALSPRPWRRLRAFADGAARKYDYIVTVGAGLALARMPWGHRRLAATLRALDPMVAWRVPDGYGFHQGFFHHRRFIDQCEAPPTGWPDYALRLFDAGVGRSLWWVYGADPERIAHAIGRFPEARRAELWCGAGLACTYAGGVGEAVAQALPAAAGRYRADVLCGASLAASTRQQGNNPSPWTERVCELFLGMTAYEAATWLGAIQDAVLAGLPRGGVDRGARWYLDVRQRVTASLKETTLFSGESI